MLRSFVGLAFGLTLAAGYSVAADTKISKADADKAKKALREVQDFMGGWNLEGTQKAGGRTEAWKEKVDWAWKFKTDEPTIRVTFAEGKGKHFSKGELKYAVAKKKYVLALVGADKSEQVFEGTLVNGSLKMQRKDAKSGDVYRLTMNTLADGVRFSFKLERQEGGRGLFANAFLMNGNKEGESLAGGSKKPECIVTGGAASIAVSYQGKTYYVCCTGCRDAFNESPEKFLKKK
ncbi:MAG TPA: YHS domain-containing protein [Urbifossiella sp.]|jgi:YHS domain-containing protein|nr:YHS domain-containing protein [Urbifossiella sp.]